MAYITVEEVAKAAITLGKWEVIAKVDILFTAWLQSVIMDYDSKWKDRIYADGAPL